MSDRNTIRTTRPMRDAARRPSPSDSTSRRSPRRSSCGGGRPPRYPHRPRLRPRGAHTHRSGSYRTRLPRKPPVDTPPHRERTFRGTSLRRSSAIPSRSRHKQLPRTTHPRYGSPQWDSCTGPMHRQSHIEAMRPVRNSGRRGHRCRLGSPARRRSPPAPSRSGHPTPRTRFPQHMPRRWQRGSERPRHSRPGARTRRDRCRRRPEVRLPVVVQRASRRHRTQS